MERRASKVHQIATQHGTVDFTCQRLVSGPPSGDVEPDMDWQAYRAVRCIGHDLEMDFVGFSAVQIANCQRGDLDVFAGT